jgi:hypothetical protein
VAASNLNADGGPDFIVGGEIELEPTATFTVYYVSEPARGPLLAAGFALLRALERLRRRRQRSLSATDARRRPRAGSSASRRCCPWRGSGGAGGAADWRPTRLDERPGIIPRALPERGSAAPPE